jgi:hypothetical protein
MADAITVERFVEELQNLKNEMTAGNLEHSEYDQRLARIITELRERGLDADRPKITATLEDVLAKGIITPSVKEHLENRLGL